MSETRYETEQEILTDIEKTRKRIGHYYHKANAFEENMRAFRIKPPEWHHLIPEEKRKMEYCLKMATRLEECKMATLKEKLSEFRTPQLAACDNGDPSIPKLIRKPSPRKGKKISIQAAVHSTGQSDATKTMVPSSPNSVTVGANI
jgi:hypothetical protein